MTELHWWAVVVAGVAQWLIGWAWYSALFQKQWLALSGITMGGEKKGMVTGMIGGLVSAIVMSAVFAWILANMPAGLTMATTLHIALLLWLGFIAATMINSVLYEKKSFALFAINSGYYLVSLLVMGLILAGWQ